MSGKPDTLDRPYSVRTRARVEQAQPMILSAYLFDASLDGAWHGAEAAGEVAGLLSAVIDSLDNTSDDAVICFASERLSRRLRDTTGANGILQVALNKSTGYGALMWNAHGNAPTWISDNPEPPKFDPRVIADPGYSLFHHPDSTLPVAKFTEALEEFAYFRTGERPACIQWTRGDICGRRQDRDMGYNFHITRAQNWLQGREAPIAQAEWESIADSLEALVADGHVDQGEDGTQTVYALSGELAKFSWRRGRIDVTGLFSDPVKSLMADLAQQLNANVYGDDEFPTLPSPIASAK